MFQARTVATLSARHWPSEGGRESVYNSISRFCRRAAGVEEMEGRGIGTGTRAGGVGGELLLS